LRLPALFVDTSAWVALLDVSDGLHERASAFWKAVLAEDRRFLTSDYVLDEAYTLLRRRRNGLRMAVLLHDLATGSALIEEAEIGPELRALGWEIFAGYRDKVLSFTDCTSFALMRKRAMLEVFTFDADFQRLGFITLPEPYRNSWPV
jgi:hypothetical protein